jgi:hypothetical protein
MGMAWREDVRMKNLLLRITWKNCIRV